jgi:reverse transcriptase-like protein
LTDVLSQIVYLVTYITGCSSAKKAVHSPKFPLKAKSLRDVINVSRLKSTWKNKVREAMRRQPIPDPLENLDFHTRIEAICTTIEAEVLSASYIPHPPIRFLSEKSKGLCRQLVIPSVKDALVLQTLSDALWAEIRLKAPTKKSFYAPGDHQFSKVIKGHSSEYGSLNAWLAFQEKIFGFAKTKKYIVVTDIANYYDSISYDHLRNILADLSLAREHALDLLIFTLSCMLWQPDYMPRVPVGLPQSNLDAPRLLAHCFLFEIDDLLSHMNNIDFARYMDDMDVGVDTISDARIVLRDLDLALQTRQIRLNSGKTKILYEREAQQHFKIRENVLLDKLADRVSAKLAARGSLDKEKRQVELAIRAGLRRSTFSSGNGEKIFKRLLNFARQVRADLDDKLFRDIMCDWPGLRQVTLTWWQQSASPETKLQLLSNLFVEGSLVDDAAKMDVTMAVVAARLPKNKLVADQISIILSNLSQATPWDFYSKVWLLSKYGSDDELIGLVETTVSLWVTQEHLSRLVAGLFPRFIGSPHRSKFEAIILHAGNAWSVGVLRFHQELAAGTKGYTAIKNFVLARNTSLPNGISHSKFLIVLSLLNNPDIAPAAAAKLKKVHARALSDAHYCSL